MLHIYPCITLGWYLIRFSNLALWIRVQNLVWSNSILFLIYFTPCIYITYRSSHYNWLILFPYFNLVSWTRVPNFIWLCQVVFVSYCSGHPEYITYRSQFWAICSIALGPEIWQRSSLSEGKYSHPLHSLWPVALTMARCIISFCKSIAGPHLQKWRCLLCLTESSYVIHWFPCDKNLIHLSTLYRLYIHSCIIKGSVALGFAITRRS